MGVVSTVSHWNADNLFIMSSIAYRVKIELVVVADFWTNFVTESSESRQRDDLT